MLFSARREQNSRIVATKAETVTNDFQCRQYGKMKGVSALSAVNDPTGGTNRKLDTPEKTLNLNSRVVDQEFCDEKVAE